jgi:hypothetical protein
MGSRDRIPWVRDGRRFVMTMREKLELIPVEDRDVIFECLGLAYEGVFDLEPPPDWSDLLDESGSFSCLLFYSGVGVG